MKKTIFKNSFGFLVVANFVLVFTSCQKNHDTPFNDNPEAISNSKEANSATVFSSCTGTIPAKLNVPAGNKLLLETYASGVQIYQVRRDPLDPADFDWVFVGPSADVFALPNYVNKVANHYGGPTWEFIKGPFKNEKVVAAKIDEATPDPTTIPWLLLKTDDIRSTPGNKITYIQRLCTTGGLAPNSEPTENMQGQLDSIPYTAVYRLFVNE